MVTPEPQKKLTGRRVFVYLMIFFGVIAAVNAVFITKALQSNSGVVYDNPYERGLGYNKILEEHDRQVALGWKGKTTIESGTTLVYKLMDKNGKPVTEAKIVAHMLRPVQKGYDFDVPLLETSPGQYAASLTLPVKGAWNAHVEALRGTDHHEDLTSLDIE